MEEMQKKKYLAIAGVVSLLAIVSIAAIYFQTPAGTGYLEGKITIGPLCPVGRIPPDLNCQPTEATYKAWPTAIWTPGKIILVANIYPDNNGTYKIALPAGSYVVDIERQQSIGARNLPANVVVRANESTTLDINIDTGIR
jgi:hypothetical protein